MSGACNVLTLGSTGLASCTCARGCVKDLDTNTSIKTGFYYTHIFGVWLWFFPHILGI